MLTYLYRSEDAAFAQHQIPQPSLNRYSSNFEDPFSDALSVYDHAPHVEQNVVGDSPSIDSNHKLLSFSLPNYHYQLLDYALRRTSINLTAQLHGMFFLAESPWANVGDAAGPPSELTCYRRNLFQITGQITLPRTLQYILTEKGEQIPILGQELTISATESVEGNPVKIISVPWKTPATNQPTTEDKSEKEPPSIALDLSNGQEMDSEFVNFPIAWKRLQFRIATANNGRRKELQQHFVVRLKLVVTLANGSRVPVAEVQSGAIIVRGRSPRNFQARKDFPIGTGGSAARKASQMSTQQPGKHVTSDNNNAVQPTSTTNSTTYRADRQDVKPARPDIPSFPFAYDPASNLDVTPDFLDWKMPQPPTGTGAMTAIPDAAYQQTPHAGYAQTTPDLSRAPPTRSTPQAPLPLSLTDDPIIPSPHIASASPPSPSRAKAPKLTNRRSHSFSLNMISSPDEGADMLYEYFPLSLDDWMPPVDAVYRPHVVHHTTNLGGATAGKREGRSKRYFSEDQAVA